MLKPGLIVLHGNRLEDLLEAVSGWLREQPLAPLEEETFLVQSQGMGEWVRMQLAERQGISAALRIELPARFLWRAYRAVLGPRAVPQRSPLDKAPLTWRLMASLPRWVEGDAATFLPLREFLHDGSPLRRLQLAQRLADLFDQYQVHRGDWLTDWTNGEHRLRRLPHTLTDAKALTPEDAWQPALWQQILASLPEAERQLSRPAIHAAFLESLRQSGAGQRPWPQALPRRVVVFGTTHVPRQSLEAIAALAEGSQVLMAVPNPCRHYWADLIPDRELLTATRRRQATRPGMPEADLDLAELAPHGHPLLAAWGRQARDFIRLLDHHDDVARTRERFGEQRIDFFDEGGLDDGSPWLHQVQARIRELVPVHEDPPGPLSPADRSIVFHVAHHAQREVEVLHDQLLRLFAEGTTAGPLSPRDVVVMVPDVATFEPAIRSVFGQHEGTGDARRIPYRIADLRDRGRSPLMVALEWLLGVRTERFTLSGLRSLLDVPAVRERFDLTEDDIPLLGRWLERAGVRWGLSAAQRASLGLASAGEQNTWLFGLRRLLLGYAVGRGGFRDIEACDEVGGLEAAKLGALADIVEAVEQWWQLAGTNQAPQGWQRALQGLRRSLFRCVSPTDRTLELALDEAMAEWLEACEAAGFTEAIGPEVVRDAWLEAVDDPGLPRRFRASGVTFCTLLPLRAVPFRVVCLLGMNDGDYPRRAMRSDLDLMARNGLQRPGDRSGRDDDRQLMLDALLSARDILYVSWTGRSQRDDSEQPPSVLVSQFRDYLEQVWSTAAVAARTTHHPLQPFSTRYFAPEGAWFTYAREWHAMHGLGDDTGRDAGQGATGVSPVFDDTALDGPLGEPTPEELYRFLRNPVREFFRQRLQVQFDKLEEGFLDEEPFTLEGLEGWSLLEELLESLRRREALATEAPTTAESLHAIERDIDALARAGRLPLGTAGALRRDALVAELAAMAGRWQELRREGAAVELLASRLANSKGNVRTEKLLRAWIRLLHEGRDGVARPLNLVAPDGALVLTAPTTEECSARLTKLSAAWRRGMSADAPLPTALATGLALVADADPSLKYESSGPDWPGESAEPCLARLFPDFESLVSAGTMSAGPAGEPVSAFAWWSRELYADFHLWAKAIGPVEAYSGSVEMASDDSSDD